MKHASHRWLTGFTIVLAIVLLSGCASAPSVYMRTEPYYLKQQVDFGEDREQIEQGRPIPVLDGVSHYVLSVPIKLLFLNWNMIDHELRPEDRALLEYYFELNQMTAVKVRHNQYAPFDELRRLTRNTEVGAGYRYTFGLVSWLQYTLLPDRLFAGVPLLGVGDHFNPFTNTINVYSSDLAVLLHEAGHAKDYVRHDMKGTSFILPGLLPGVDLIHEATASRDAVAFLYCVGEQEREVAAYGTLIPAYATYVGGFVGGGELVALPVLAGGHVVGWAQARARAQALALEEDVPAWRPDYCMTLAEARRQQQDAVNVAAPAEPSPDPR